MPQISFLSVFGVIMPIPPETLELIAQFGAFGVAMLWVWSLQKQISDLKLELKDSRVETKAARDRHEADLRDWSGIDPRFKTWSVNAESDTKLRLRMEERERLREHVDKHLEPPK